MMLKHFSFYLFPHPILPWGLLNMLLSAAPQEPRCLKWQGRSIHRPRGPEDMATPGRQQQVPMHVSSTSRGGGMRASGGGHPAQTPHLSLHCCLGFPWQQKPSQGKEVQSGGHQTGQRRDEEDRVEPLRAKGSPNRACVLNQLNLNPEPLHQKTNF